MARAEWLTGAEIAKGVRNEDEAALTALYQMVKADHFRVIGRQLGFDEALDVVHEVYIAAVIGLRRGELRNDAHLRSWVYGIARNTVICTIHSRGRNRKRNLPIFPGLPEMCVQEDVRPDWIYEQGERERLFGQALHALSAHERELLVRFYLLGQSAACICAAMRLTDTQYRLRKWRAKHRIIMLAAQIKRGSARKRLAESLSLTHATAAI